ncbi:MAG: ABC transporter permease [Phycisphaerales bacterium]
MKPATPPSQPRVIGGRRRVTAGRLGALALCIILAACIGSLPWTLAQVSRDGIEQKRFELAHLDGFLLPPSWAWHAADERERRADAGHPVALLGTDRLGRDLASRCMVGGCFSLLIGAAAAAIAVCIGASWGMIAGYAGGRVDAILMRIVDVLYGLPYILLVVLLAVAVDSGIEAFEASGRRGWLAEFVLSHRGGVNIFTLVIAIGAVSWLTMARVVRGQMQSLRQRPFVEAARAIGVPTHVILRRHLLPNLLGPIIVFATLAIPQAILQESFLSFLGIGVKPPLPSWGNLAAEGLAELNPVRSRWWLLLWPCLLLAITLLSLNLVGDSLREAFDPRRQLRAQA